MTTLDLPSPKHNTHLGFHYYPDETHYRSEDLQTWLPRLRALGTSWITLRGSMARAIPEQFVSGLLDAGIEPIVHIPAVPIQPVDLDAIGDLARVYAGWGLNYLVLYDTPNDRQSWPDGMFDRSDLVDRFLDLWIPAADAACEMGMLPILPPLKQGGTYWDTSFLSAVLDKMASREKGTDYLLEKLILGAYAFAGPHPPDWGRGGTTGWPSAQPYMTPTDSQDQRGFWSFEWYSEVAQQELGTTLPILMMAGGAVADETDPTTGQPKDLAWHTSCNLCIARAAIDGQLPDYLLNVNYWVLCASPESEYALQAWYKPGDSTLPIVRELKHLIASDPNHISKPDIDIDGTKSNTKNRKSLTHYVLLPIFESGPSEWHWRAAGRYVRKLNSACGYSTLDAANAESVTIVGTEDQISSEIEGGLWNEGCQVNRITGEDYVDLSSHLALAIQ